MTLISFRFKQASKNERQPDQEKPLVVLTPLDLMGRRGVNLSDPALSGDELRKWIFKKEITENVTVRQVMTDIGAWLNEQDIFDQSSLYKNVGSYNLSIYVVAHPQDFLSLQEEIILSDNALSLIRHDDSLEHFQRDLDRFKVAGRIETFLHKELGTQPKVPESKLDKPWLQDFQQASHPDYRHGYFPLRMADRNPVDSYCFVI